MLRLKFSFSTAHMYIGTVLSVCDLLFLAQRWSRFNMSSTSRSKSSLMKSIGSIQKKTAGFSNITKIGLAYLTFLVLSLIGGVIFHFCEYANEQERIDINRQVWTKIQETLNHNQEDLELVRKYSEYSDKLVEVNKWEWRYSCFFAATIFTTTGYGLQAATTIPGKISVVLFAVFAIPLYGIIARKIGLVFMVALEFIWLRILNCIYKNKAEEIWERRKFSLIGFSVLSMCFLLSLIIYSTAEEEGFGQGINTFWDALYFLWITTSTIGFGDVMMSGSAPFLTALIGLWMAATCGLLICFITALGANLMEMETQELEELYNDSSSEETESDPPNKGF